MTKKGEVRVGVIGIGTMGAAHARDLQAGKVGRAVLTAVADADSGALARISGAERFRDGKALIDSGLVDAVVIATPHPDHPSSAAAALDAGLHVLVEKPLAAHKADCEHVIAAYARRPRAEQVFAEMFNQRTDPRYIKVRDLIQSGELGEIRRVAWTFTDCFRTDAYYRSGGWRATWRGEGGGVLLNQAPHQLDLLVWLFGMPVRVRAFCGFGAFHDIEVEDRVTAYLEFKGGATGVFITSTGEAPGENRLVVVADRGRVVVEAGKVVFTRNDVPTDEFKRTSNERFAAPPARPIEFPAAGPGAQHLGILQNFVAAILDGESLIAPAVEGMASVELANAMIESALGGDVVELPLDATRYAALLADLVSGARSARK